MSDKPKRTLSGSAAVKAAGAKVMRERIFLLLKEKPMSTSDLADLGLAPKHACVGHITELKRQGRAVQVSKLPRRAGGPTAYYRAVGSEQADDAEYCLLHHSATRGMPKPHVDRATEEDLEARWEQQMKDAARAKSQKIKPFRCPMTEAFFGPYVKEGS